MFLFSTKKEGSKIDVDIYLFVLLLKERRRVTDDGEKQNLNEILEHAYA